jgi:hypothetical protein
MNYLALTKAVAVGLVAIACTTIGPAIAQDGDGFIFNSSLRSENVSEVGLAHDAHALTLRNRFGFQSAWSQDFSFLIEAESIIGLSDSFNDTLNGMVDYPVVADPDTLELNRLQFSFSGIDDTKITVGRQTLDIGDGRYVGSDGGRQNQQTYDAVTVENSSFDNLSLSYSYVDQALTVLGSDSPFQHLELDAHLAQAAITNSAGTFTAAAIFEDMPDSPFASNRTLMVNWTGAFGADDGVSVNYLLEYAQQSEYADNPASFDLDLLTAEIDLSQGPFTGVLGFETRGGDGTLGFYTPLASGYRFMGWGDPFAASGTPADGIRGAYVAGRVSIAEPVFGSDIEAMVRWHKFETDDGGVDLGSELNASLSSQLNDHVSLELRGAFYDGTQASPASVDKIWFTLSFSN